MVGFKIFGNLRNQWNLKNKSAVILKFLMYHSSYQSVKLSMKFITKKAFYEIKPKNIS